MKIKNIETPIFTVKLDKYENLTRKLVEDGIIAEGCRYFINLYNKYDRMRINKDYEKIIKLFSKIL